LEVSLKTMQTNIVVGFAQNRRENIGLVGNQPQSMAGSWIIMPLLRLLDLYVHVIVSMCLCLVLVDCAGFLPDPIKNGMV